MEIVQGYDYDPCIEKISKHIAELHNSIFPDSKTHDSKYWIVIKWHGQPIAQASLKWIFDHDLTGYWHMYNFGVRKLRRREGWGRKLFQSVIEHVQNKPLIWFVNQDNVDGQLFFHKMGAINFGPTIKKGVMMGYRRVD